MGTRAAGVLAGVLVALLAAAVLSGCGRKPKRAEVTRVTLGRDTACFATKDGATRCIGTSWGLPPAHMGDQPEPVASLAGAERAFFLEGTGAGQLGCRIDAPKDGPRALRCTTRSGAELALPDVGAVAWGADAVCAVDRAAGGAVRCVVGEPSAPAITARVEPGAPANALALCVGAAWGCAVTASREVACWGFTQGLLPQGNVGSKTAAVPGVTDATEVSCGEHHACARHASGRVTCWGTNDAGQVGRPKEKATLTPGLVDGVEGALHVCAGHDSTCAHMQNGLVACWGDWGAPPSTRPTIIRGVFGVSDLACAGPLTVAVANDYAVYAWGSDPGQRRLLPGSRAKMPVPAPLFVRK